MPLGEYHWNYDIIDGHEKSFSEYEVRANAGIIMMNRRQSYKGNLVWKIVLNFLIVHYLIES